MINLQSLQNTFTRFSKKEKIVFYVAVVFVSLALFDRLLIGPSQSRMKAQNEETLAKMMLIKADKRYLAAKDKVEFERKKCESYLSKSTSTEEEVTSTLKEIENLGNQAGIYIDYIRPGDVSAKGFFTKYLINLSCEGEMPQMVGFLYSIENSEKLLTIEKYVITPKTEGSSIARCRITVSKTSIH